MAVLAAVVGGPHPVMAAPVTETCRIGGWSIDRAGLAVRAAPSATARLVGRLPPFVSDGDDEYGPSFEILEARGGWLRIARTRDDFRPADRPARPVFAGGGWIDGGGARVAAQSGTGRAAPRADAPAIVALAGEVWLAGVDAVRAVLDCRGGWVRVLYRLPAGTRAVGRRAGTAWFSGICPDQRTTCEVTPPP